MKSVLISIKPEWVGKITSGKKTIEVRKSAPKEVPFKAYIYMTKKKPYMLTFAGNGKMRVHNGMVIGEFICDKVYKIEPIFSFYDCYSGYDDSSDSSYFEDYSIDDERLKKTCLTRQELYIYGKEKKLYGWHISDLKIYDKPKKLSEFYTIPESGSDCCCGCVWHETPLDEMPCRTCTGERKYLYRPPQSWMYVEEIETR